MGFGALTCDECMLYLAQVPVGRVGVTISAWPGVLQGRKRAGRSSWQRRRTPPSRAADDAVVAFQADSFESRARRGWSVQGVGGSIGTPVVEVLGEGVPGAGAPDSSTGERGDDLIELCLQILSGHELT